MNLLLIGGGGREHAIAWKLRQSPKLTDLHVAPGNAGTAEIAHNVDLPLPKTGSPASAFEPYLDAAVSLARDLEVDLVFVAPDDPLSWGLVDRLEAAGIAAFGPSKRAAELEASKAWSAAFVERAGIPHPQHRALLRHRCRPRLRPPQLDAARRQGRRPRGRQRRHRHLHHRRGLARNRRHHAQPRRGRRRQDRRDHGPGHRPRDLSPCLHRRQDGHFDAAVLRPQARIRRQPWPEHRRHGRLQPAALGQPRDRGLDPHHGHGARRGRDGRRGPGVPRRHLPRRYGHGRRHPGLRVQLPSRRSRDTGPAPPPQDRLAGDRLGLRQRHPGQGRRRVE